MYMISVGMAIIRPQAVVSRASEMPTASCSVFPAEAAGPALAMSLKAWIMPSTVPSSPSSGVTVATPLSTRR